MPLQHYESLLPTKNAQLREAGSQPIIIEELIGARLYTGPIFYKYNTALRAVGFGDKCAYVGEVFKKMCHGNKCARYPPRSRAEIARQVSTTGAPASRRISRRRYATTMHVINSVIVKLAKLTAATTVYRGISGFKLPPQFWKPNKFKVAPKITPRSRQDHAKIMPRPRRDHVHRRCAAASSTPSCHARAPKTSHWPTLRTSNRKGRGWCLRSRWAWSTVALISRGSRRREIRRDGIREIPPSFVATWHFPIYSHVAQYPHELEILFPPLTSIEVRSLRVEKKVRPGLDPAPAGQLCAPLHASLQRVTGAGDRGAHVGEHWLDDREGGAETPAVSPLAARYDDTCDHCRRRP